MLKLLLVVVAALSGLADGPLSSGADVVGQAMLHPSGSPSGPAAGTRRVGKAKDARLGRLAATPQVPAVRDVWDDVADCESGLRGPDGRPLPGSARWDYAADEPSLFEGGLQFHPDTWDAFRDPDMASAAGAASRVVQVEVAERVLAAQGWRAWPTCSVMLGLRPES